MAHSRYAYSPYGTVSSREEYQEAVELAGRPPRPPRYLEPVLQRAAARDVGVELCWLAWELVVMQPGLGDEDRRALYVLVLASLIRLQEGSTCVPLRTGQPEADGALGELLESLLPVDDPDWEPVRLRARAESVLWERRAPELVALMQDDVVTVEAPRRPLVVAGGALYHQRVLHHEERLVEAVAQRLGRPAAIGDSLDPKTLQGAWDDLLASMPRLARPGATPGPAMRLTAEQQYAVLTALFVPLALITGGPGTGKTSIVVTLLRLLVRLGVEPEALALAAPTGKAAMRLSEAIGWQLSALDAPSAHDEALTRRLPEPQTLHRLLGYSARSGQFYHHEHNQLDARIVIVDEASMIDLVVMERLVRAVGQRATLVLLGDAGQLPSVEYGAVFRELLPTRADTTSWWRELVRSGPGDQPELASVSSQEPCATGTARLVHSHRMRREDAGGRAILETAASISEGHAPALVPTSLGAAFEQPGVHLVVPEPDRGLGPLLERFVEEWFLRQLLAAPGFYEAHLEPFDYGQDAEAGFTPRARARLEALYQGLQRARVLCLTRVSPTGSRALNEAFVQQLRVLRRVGDAVDRMLPGAPVMMLRNDYDKNLFNGDQGLIVPVRLEGGRPELMAVFPRTGEGFVPFHLGGLRATLEVAFAMTVHKAQGSEYEDVAMILPAEEIPLLSREILYTGLTRASRSVTILGHQALLEQAVVQRTERYSRLGIKLERRLAGPEVGAEAPGEPGDG